MGRRKRRAKGVYGEGSVYRRRSDGRWVASLRWGGTLYRLTRVREVDCRRWLAALRARLEVGAAGAPDARTLGEYLGDWLSVNAPRWAPRTARTYRVVCELLGELLAVPVCELAPEKIRGRLMLVASRRAASTARLCRAALHSALGQAVSDGIIASNPVSRVAAAKEAEPRRRALSEYEARGLLVAAGGDRLEALCWILVVYGLRQGEARGLRWSDFQGDRLTVGGTLQDNLERGPTKGKRRLVLPVPAALAEVLERHRAAQLVERQSWRPRERAGELVFTRPGGRPLGPDQVRRWLARLCDQAGIERVTPHELRHTAATHLAPSGTSEARQVLGHASLRVTERYLHPDLERVGRNLEGWARRLGGG